MRVFEKISRRLAIYMAGVVAASTFAVPMAPAITAYAETIDPPKDADELSLNKDIIAKLQAEAVQLENGKAVTVTLEPEPKPDANAEKPSEEQLAELMKTQPKMKNAAVYKIKSGIDGKFHVTVKATETVKKVWVEVFKKDAQEATKRYPIDNLAKDAEKDEEVDVKKDEEWFILVTNSDEAAAAKFELTAEIRQNGKKTKLRSVESPAKKTAKATFKKVKDVDGYEVMVSTSKDFDKNVKKASKKAKKVKFDKKKAGSIEVKKLKAGKKYYVRVRTYVEEGGVKYYSDWSSVKKIKKVK
ncbi:hypothetical protein [Butyrivibrio sp. AC2005]|uniref:hypothetical protein n=1 Tax=Butyrivibrio sp. AC2005 TaxID=1280672 RepID=UPI000406B5F2|nr:hypothetical protein [Butyrivibrio sp. AC2005]